MQRTGNANGSNTGKVAIGMYISMKGMDTSVCLNSRKVTAYIN